MSDDAPSTLDSFGMTDLEERLRGPQGNAVRSAAADRLATMAARVATALAEGAPPHRYARLVAMRDAVALATRVVAPEPHSNPRA